MVWQRKLRPSKEERECGGGDSDHSETEKLMETFVVLNEESKERTEDISEHKREALAHQAGSISTPPGCDTNPSQVTSQHFVGLRFTQSNLLVPIYIPWWRGAL